MRNREEIIADLDRLLKQHDELTERIEQTKRELADYLDRQLEESNTEMKRLRNNPKRNK